VFCTDRVRVHVCRDRHDPAGVTVPRPPGLWHGYRPVQHHPLHRGRQPALGTASARITEVALGMERPPISVHCAVHGVVPPILVHTFEGGELPVRVLVSLMAIVPAGILMGFGFPTGMRLVNGIDTRPTPWFWA